MSLSEFIDKFDVMEFIALAKEEKPFIVTSFDQIFRLRMMKYVKSLDVNSKNNQLQLVQMTIDVAKADCCSKNLSVLLLGDLLDLSPITECDQIFTFVEKHVITWKSEQFFDPCKNYLLRLCNDLLRRVSRVVHTEFCGRILVFLAKVLPLTEKSGLNIASMFNTENETQFDDTEIEQEHKEKVVDPDTVTAEKGLIDFNLYRKFWSLQGSFASPLTCFDALNWRKFTNNANDVIKVLQTWQLDQIESGHKDLLDCDESPASKRRRISSGSISGFVAEEDAYFAKYLTNQKLLQLQLGDSLFRRFFLTQFLVIFQFLQTDSKIRTERKLHLTEIQNKWISENTEKVFKLLAETKPDGDNFADAIKSILKREILWNEWKNQTCFDYTIRAEKNFKMPSIKKRRGEFNPDEIDMGNPTLTTLWKLTTCNLEACRDRKRNFVPKMEDFIRDAYHQSDPDFKANGGKNKDLHDENYQWRMARYLSSHSAHYFTCKDDPIVNIPAFLEEVIITTADSLPEYKVVREEREHRLNAKDIKVNNERRLTEGDTIQLTYKDSVIEDLDDEPMLTSEARGDLIVLLKDNWELLARKYSMSDESIKAHKKKSDDSEVLSIILDQWCEAEGRRATLKRFMDTLLDAEVVENAVFQYITDKRKEAGLIPG